MGRRRRRFDESNNILLSEFLFYNKEKQLITDEEVKKIKEQLKTLKPVVDEMFWSNEVYANGGIVFKFYSQYKDTLKVTDNYIELLDLNFKFTLKDLEGIKEIYQNKLFIKFDITDEQIKLLNNLDHYHSNDCLFKKVNNETWLNKVFNTWDEIIEYLIVNEELKSHESYWERFEDYIKSMLGITLTKPIYKVEHTDGKYSWNMHTFHIFKVIEKRINDKNYRVMFTSQVKGYAEVDYTLSVIPEDDINYNNIDEGNVYIVKDNIYYILAPQLVIKGEDNSIFIDLDICNIIEDNINRIISKNDAKVITPTIYKFYSTQVRRFMFKDQKFTEVEKKILEQYAKLLNQGRTVKLDQIFITPTSVYTENNEFSIKFDKAFFDVEDNFITLKREIDRGEAKYNFNILYEIILKRSKINIINRSSVKDSDYKEFTEATFTVNNMKLTVRKDGNRINIGGIFCRIDDTMDILSKAICFNNINDYLNYVKDVSYIGLEWKKMISTGIHLYLENPFINSLRKMGYKANDKVIMRFSLLWDTQRRSDIYLLINSKKYLIRFKHKFLRAFDYPGRTLRLTSLNDILRESLDNFNEEQIIEIAENAIKEAKIIEERGRIILAETIKETKAVEDKISTQDRNVEGYVVIGIRTNAKYFIDKLDLNVYKFTEGKWNRRCVVSDPNKQRIYEDRLANRLINIYNENERIKTLFN